MVGWSKLCNLVYRICLTPFIEYVYHFFIEYLWHLLLKNIAKASHISKNWNFCRLSKYVTEAYNHNLTFWRRQQCTNPNSCIRGARARALSVARPVTTISAPLKVWVLSFYCKRTYAKFLPVQGIKDWSCSIISIHGVDCFGKGLSRKHFLSEER